MPGSIDIPLFPGGGRGWPRARSAFASEWGRASAFRVGLTWGRLAGGLILGGIQLPYVSPGRSGLLASAKARGVGSGAVRPAGGR